MLTIEHFEAAIWMANAVFFGLMALWLLGQALLMIGGFVYGIVIGFVTANRAFRHIKRGLPSA